MEDKDTVMARQDIEGYIFGDKVWAMIKDFLQVQAEISFKAGQEKVMRLIHPYFQVIAKHHHEAGIREVVDYPKYYASMEAHKDGDIDDLIEWGWKQAAGSECGEVYLIALPRHKLKEWGLSDENEGVIDGH